MCYGMFEKRSDAAKKSIESRITADTRAEKASATYKETVAGHLAEDKAYAGFKSRIQHWMVKDEEKEST